MAAREDERSGPVTRSFQAIVGDDVRSHCSLGLLPKPALSRNVLIRDNLRRLLRVPTQLAAPNRRACGPPVPPTLHQRVPRAAPESPHSTSDRRSEVLRGDSVGAPVGRADGRGCCSPISPKRWEIQAIKDANAREHGADFAAMMDDLRKRQEQSGRKIIRARRQPRRVCKWPSRE